MNSRIAPLALFGLVACGGGRVDVQPPPVNAVTVVERIDLASKLGHEDVDVTGVAIAPDTGATYVLDAAHGIYRLDADGASLVADLATLRAPWAEPKSAFTDLAAIGQNRFALTALSDGFLYEADTNRFISYFCYEPGFIPGEDPLPADFTQLTNALTFDSASDKLYAQPRSFESPDMAAAFRNDIGQFDLEGGEGYGWIELADVDFTAGGMAVVSDTVMLLGAGSKLHWVNRESGAFLSHLDLSKYGVGAIEGLTYDGADLLIVDGANDTLVRLRL